MADIYIKVELQGKEQATRDLKQIENAAERAMQKMQAMEKIKKSAMQGASDEMSKRATMNQQILKSITGTEAATKQQVQTQKQAITQTMQEIAVVNKLIASKQKLAAVSAVRAPGATGLMGAAVGVTGTAQQTAAGMQKATAAATAFRTGWTRTQQQFAQTMSDVAFSTAETNDALTEMSVLQNKLYSNLRPLGTASPFYGPQIDDLNTIKSLQGKVFSAQGTKEYDRVLQSVTRDWTDIRDAIRETADMGLNEMTKIIRADTLPSIGKLEAGMTRVRRTVGALEVGTKEWARQSEILARMQIFKQELGSKDPLVRAQALSRYGREANQLFKEVDEGARKADKRMSVFNGRFAKMAVYMSGIAATIFVFQNLVQVIGAIMRPFLDLEKAAINLRQSFGATGSELKSLLKTVERADFSGAMNADKAAQQMADFKKQGFSSAEAMELLKSQIYELDTAMEDTVTGSLEKFKAGIRDLFRGLGATISDELKTVFDFIRKETAQERIEREFPEYFERNYPAKGKWGFRRGGLDVFVDKRSDVLMQNAEKILDAIRMPIDIGLPGSEADIRGEQAIRERTQRIIQNSNAALKTAHEVSGRMNEALIYDFKENLREITEALELFGESIGTIAGVRAELIYQQTRKQMQPFYDAAKTVYDERGQLTQIFYNEEAARIKHGADVLRRLGFGEAAKVIERQQMFALKQKAVLSKEFKDVGYLSEKQVKAMESMYTDTKYYDPRLEKYERLRASMKKYETIERLGESARPEAEYIEALEMYEVDQKVMAKRMELQKKFFSETNIMSTQYYEDRATQINTETELAIKGGQKASQAYRIKAKRMQKLDDESTAYAVSKWEDMYQKGGDMTDAYYEHRKKLIIRDRDETIEATKDIAGAWTKFQRLMADLESERILAKSTSKSYDAIEARRLQMMVKPITAAQRGMETLNQILAATEDGFQSLFGQVFSSEITNAKDMLSSLGNHFMSVVQNMAAKALAANLMQSLFGNLMQGGAGAGMASGLLPMLVSLFTPTTTTGYSGPMSTSPYRLMHTGGQESYISRMISPFVFAGAPRLHGGLAADEYPAILQHGETVIPRNGAMAAAPVDIVVNNYGNDNVKVQEQRQPGGRRQIQVSIAEDIYKRGPLAQSMENVYGLRRTGRNI